MIQIRHRRSKQKKFSSNPSFLSMFRLGTMYIQKTTKRLLNFHSPTQKRIVQFVLFSSLLDALPGLNIYPSQHWAQFTFPNNIHFAGWLGLNIYHLLQLSMSQPNRRRMWWMTLPLQQGRQWKPWIKVQRFSPISPTTACFAHEPASCKKILSKSML